MKTEHSDSNLTKVNQHDIKALLEERILNPKKYADKPVLIWRGCFSDLKFTTPASKQVADALDYCLEEALANLIAYRSIRNRRIKKEDVRDIAEFMKHQPMPYALGIKMGLAELTKHASLDFIIKSYVLKWYMAKSDQEDLAIADYKGWWDMVKKAGPFTDIELKEQYETLFSKP